MNNKNKGIKTSKKSSDTGYLKSVGKALDVLEYLSWNRSVGVTKLSREMKMGTSTSHRILVTLEQKGFVVQDPATGKYSIGHKIFKLARTFINTIEPVKYVQPYLDELCEKTGENISFCIVSPALDRTLIIAERVADKPVIARPALFRDHPIDACACGKAFLMTVDENKVIEILKKCRKPAVTKIKKQLVEFKKTGYTVSRDEYSAGLSSMAARILNAEDEFEGAIMITSPTYRMDNERIKYWGKLLLSTSEKLNLKLKYV